MEWKTPNGQQGYYIDLENLTTYYQEAGDGPPLILLHGGGLTSSVWDTNRSLLSSHFHVFTPDCRGHGRTNNPIGNLNYRLLADDLADFISILHLEKPFLCGWSMGASIVLEFGMRYPDIAQAQVCCAGGPPLSGEEINEIIQEEKQLLNSPAIVENMKTQHSWVYGSDYWKNLIAQLHELMREGYSERAFSQIAAPTLILCGDGEARPGVEAYVALYRKLAQGELAVIPNVDHFYPTTNVEMFTNVITEFFLRRGG